MKKHRKVCIAVVFLFSTICSADSRGQEIDQAIMDCASSAIVEDVIYSGDDDFSFALRASGKEGNLTDQDKFGERSRIVLKFNADTLNGTQVVVYPDSEVITSETLGLSGRRFLNLLISRMHSQVPINLTFSVKTRDQAVLETESAFDIEYFQLNGD